MSLILFIIQLSRTVDLHLSKALFSLDPDNQQLHCFLELRTLLRCSFFDRDLSTNIVRRSGN